MPAASSRVAAAAAAALSPPLTFSAEAAAQSAPATGKLAWYGGPFAGRTTASGERYDPNAMTMAHKTLPFGTRVKVTNRSNGRSVVLRVNDRGPTQDDRVGDVSQAAAHRLGMVRPGVVEADLAPLEGKAPKRG